MTFTKNGHFFQVSRFCGNPVKWVSTNYYIFVIEPNLKKSLKSIQSYVDASFSGPTCPIWVKQESFQKKPLIWFSCTCWPHSLFKKILKILGADPELWGCIFLAQNGQFPWRESFSGKTLMQFWCSSWPVLLR